MPEDVSAPPPSGSAAGVAPADVETWLADLDLDPIERATRGAVASWDIVLDGRRRRDLRVTLILDPGLGLICWAQLAPPILDGLRKAYRTLLEWNDAFPFAKFSMTRDGRPNLSVELDRGRLDADALGLALVRLCGIADTLLAEVADWLWIGGRAPEGYEDRPSRNRALLDRYAARLPELFRDAGVPGGDAAMADG